MEEEIGRYLMDLASNPNRIATASAERFDPDQIDVIIQQVLHRFPAARPDDVLQIGVREGLFPPSSHEHQNANQDEGPNPHQIAVQLVRRLLAATSDTSAAFLEHVLSEARRVDPRFSDADLRGLLDEANLSGRTSLRKLKLMPGGIHATRCFFRLSAAYRDSTPPDVAERQKIVVKALVPSTYGAPPTPHGREEWLRHLWTMLRTAGLPDVPTAVIDADVACWRTAFLYYFGTSKVRSVIEGMIQKDHPATLPLQLLIADGYTTGESLGLEAVVLTEEQERTALEELRKLQDLKKSRKETTAMPTTAIPYVNILEASTSYRNAPKLTDQSRRIYELILRALWDQYVNDGEAVRAKTLHEEVSRKVKKLTFFNFMNYFSAVKTVLEFYFGAPDRRKTIEQRVGNRRNPSNALLSKMLVTDNLRTSDHLFAGGGEEPPPSLPRLERGTERKPTAASRKTHVGKTPGNGDDLDAAIAEIDARIAELMVDRKLLLEAKEMVQNIVKRIRN